jgi:cytochrome-b5 reductase
MQPLCGELTRTLEQGPLVGVLADLGLKESQVWKLE